MSIAAKDDVAVDPDALREQVRKKYREVAIDPHGNTTSTPDAGSPPVSDMTMPRRILAGCGGGSPSPASPIRFRCGRCNGRARGRCRVGRGFRCVRRGAPGRAIGPGDRRRYDRRDARQITIHSRRARDATCRVSRRAGGASAGRGRLGRCRYQQRGDQSVRRQACGLRRDPSCAAALAVLQFADIANGSRCRRRQSTTSIFGQLELPVVCRVQPGSKCWKRSGFVDVRIGSPVDTFKGASGEKNARRFEVYGYPFLARKSE